MQLRQLDVLLPKHDAALAWLRSLGVSTDGRFEASADAMRLLPALGGMPLPERQAILPAIHSALVARVEAADLIRIWTAFRGRETAALVRRLTHARNGPPPGARESPDTALGRNYFAELAWAAVLRLNGFTPSLEYNTDVLQVERVPCPVVFAWEVKRPLSLRKLGQRLRHGRDQVDVAANDGPQTEAPVADAGCVVLVVDHLLPGNVELLDPAPQEVLRARLSRHLRGWVESHDQDLVSAFSPTTLAVVVWWRPFGLVRLPDGRALLSECSQLHFRGSLPTDSADWRYQLLWGWCQRLHVTDP